MGITGWLDPDWHKTIVAFAVEQEGGEHREDYFPIGAGFFVEHQKCFCLFTAKHVVFGRNGQARTGLFVLANQKDGKVGVISLDSLREKGVFWKQHPQKDLAATVFPYYRELDYKRFTVESFGEFSTIRDGDDVFFLGFPLGITTESKITPVVRVGIVALRKEDETLLLDANVFPGNSGGPVFFRPSQFTMTHDRVTHESVITRAIRPSKLIGVITGYIPFRDIAVSLVTWKERVIFQENSGLASALSVNFIRDILDSTDFLEMLKSLKKTERQ